MTDATTGVTRELPRYKSHKTVWALKIDALEIHEDKSATIAPVDADYAAFKTRPDWAATFKGSEADKGYYVVYADGYTSWSPTKAFEEGYTLIDPDALELAAAARAAGPEEKY